LKNRIALIGFSGAGKSTIAKKIATLLQFTVLDTDVMLEEKYHISVPAIFEKYGEKTFRGLEYNILKEALRYDNVVIATGGGASCFFDAINLINEKACSIYIEMHPKSLTQRLLHAKKVRPLTKNKTEEELLAYITEKLKQHEPFYKQAHYIIKGENFNLNKMNLPLLQYLSKNVVM
jgi:shikimate kinase